MTKITPLFVSAARAAQYMAQLLEMSLTVRMHPEMYGLPCEMAFTTPEHCSKEDTVGYYAALRLDGFIWPGLEKLVLRSYQLDLSKPRVSVVLPTKCPIDDHLGQVWRASKGEDIDYNVCSGVVLDDDDDDDTDGPRLIYFY